MNLINCQNFDAIIFDLGGVVIEVDMEKPYQKLLNISNNQNSNLYLSLKIIAKNYETGKLTDQEFREQIKLITKINCDDEYIDLLWNEMLGNVPSYLEDLLTKIKQKTRTFVLSNTNSIHIKEFEKRFKIVTRNIAPENYFEKLYYSHKIGLHKPDPKIYEFIFNEINVKKKKTLFIDDNLANINSASSFGWQTFHLNPPMRLNEIFNL